MTTKIGMWALTFVMGATLQVAGAPRDGKSEVKAETNANTKEDHLRLAVYFESRALKMRAKLTKQEELVAYWSAKSWMRDRTKIPNPLFSARNLADSYRWEWEHAVERAAFHRQLAENPGTGAAGSRP